MEENVIGSFEVVSAPDLVGGYRVQNPDDGEMWDKVGGTASGPRGGV